MATMITDECINCGACEPECPNTAIYQGGVEYEWQGGNHAALTNEFFYIVPEKCTECVGFYDHEACAAVCPVDCCVPNPNIVEAESLLLQRAREIHPDKTFADDAPSRFKQDGAAAAPAAAAAATAAPSPAAKPAAPVAAAPVAPVAPVARLGKVEKKTSAPLMRPTERTIPYGGQLPISFEEALAIAVPGDSKTVAGPGRLLLSLAQPMLGALPAATKARLEAAVDNKSVFTSAGATGLNILAHLVLYPLIALAFAVFLRGHSLYSAEVKRWFFWGLAFAVLEAVVRLREAVIFARPLSETVLRGNLAGPLLIPLVGPLLKAGAGESDTGSVAFEGYYATSGSFDDKKERERRYGEVFTLQERPDAYVLHMELPRRIPPSGVKEELGLGDEMPDYALDLALHAGRFEVHGKVVDPRLRTVAASAPAFPADFTTRIPLETPCIGFTYRQAKKDLDVVILKQSAAQRMASPANAA
jgi:ferredoxin